MVNPTNTRSATPRIAARLMPAFSSASQATSSSNRCWGSIAAASRGEMPKNSASNSSGCQEVRKPALPTADRARHGVVGASSRRRRPSGPRAPARCHWPRPATTPRYSSALFTPPGNRHPIPTTAIGSVSAFSAISRRALRSSILRSASVMIARRSGDAAASSRSTQPFGKLLEQFIFGEIVVGVDARR